MCEDGVFFFLVKVSGEDGYSFGGFVIGRLR